MSIVKGSRVQGPGARVIVKNTNKRFGLNERFIKKIVLKILEILRKPQNTKLEIIFLDNKTIRSINKKYKHRNSSTDVLSFDLGSCGQILISSDTALKNTRIFKTSFEKEIVLYIIHGILHLFGYEDETSYEKKRMSKKENNILEKICATVILSKVLTRR